MSKKKTFSFLKNEQFTIRLWKTFIVTNQYGKHSVSEKKD